MRFVLVTNDEDRLGGIFARAYLESGGPPFTGIITLPDRNSVSAGIGRAILTALKLATPIGTLRALAARAGCPLSSDRKIGLAERWPDALVGPKTATYQLQSLKEKKSLATLKSLKPDVIVSIGAPVILGPSTLDIPSIGSVNVHNGLLPKYRGHFGTFWEVYHGEPWAYVCVHEMLPKVDSGRIIGWQRVTVSDCRSFFDLLIKKKRIGGALLAGLLQDIQQKNKLPKTSPIHRTDDDGDDYFGFPSARDIWRLKWRPASSKTA